LYYLFWVFALSKREKELLLKVLYVYNNDKDTKEKEGERMTFWNPSFMWNVIY